MKRLSLIAIGMSVLALVISVIALINTKQEYTQANQAAEASKTVDAGRIKSQGSANLSEPVKVDFRLAQTKSAAGLKKLKISDQTFWYVPAPVLTRADLASVEPRKAGAGKESNKGQSFVRFVLTGQGKRKLARISGQYPGKILLLTLNGTLVAVYKMDKAIKNGTLDVAFGSDKKTLAIAKAIIGNQQGR